ncbi:MAG: lytic murein transglycosylase [Candidatus Moranbacteria bacterium]|nr:lytic murein transglycosylase [Candidatus Moranbacteria bacterium]
MIYGKTIKNLALIVFAVWLVVFDFNSFGDRVFADDLSKTQDALSNTQKKIDNTTNQLNTSKVLLQKNVVQVNTTKAAIQNTEGEIARKESELTDLNERLKLNKMLLEGYIREAYFRDQDPLAELILTGKSFDNITENFDQLLSVEDKLILTMGEINKETDDIEGVKNDLNDKKAKHEKLLQQQKIEQGGIVSDISDATATLAELQKKFAELQGDLNKLLGSNYNAKDIQDAVKYASDKTNVPVGFLVGVLKMETNLGANVGGCTYGEVESGAQASYKSGKLGKNAWATFQARRNTFQGICKELGINYQKQKVSCNPRGYAGTGGAMGVAQFMPDTWNAYKSQVSSYTGHRPPSPWNLTDGVTAMALKLSRVPGVTAGKTSAYKTAACAYLGTCYKPYIDGILYWASNYKTLLN